MDQRLTPVNEPMPIEIEITTARPIQGLIFQLSETFMLLPIMTPSVPPTICGARYSPRMGMNTKMTAAAIPGRI